MTTPATTPMSTTSTAPTPPTFEGYLESMDEEGAPLLGHLVLYSIFDGTVTRSEMERWFTEFDLDPQFVPPPLRPVDAFERVTGPAGSKVTYNLDDPSGRPVRRRRPDDPPRRTATLMVRHVTRNRDRIVRHIVREVRDEGKTKLRYQAKLGECVFEHDKTATADTGRGTMTVTPDTEAIEKLPKAEQVQAAAALRELTSAIEVDYQHRCKYLSGDKIRGVIRTYVESLGAIKVRPTGGVYFVHRQHEVTLGKLRELVARCGGGSHLVRIPLPNTDEQREMVVAAWRAKAAEDLKKLAREIADVTAAATAKPNPEDPDGTGRPHAPSKATVHALHRRFTDLQSATSEHEQLLSASLDDTHEALQLVQVQLASLLMQVTD